MQAIQNLLLTLQKFFAQNRKLFTNLFIIAEMLVMIGWFTIYFSAFFDYPSVVGIIFAYGNKLGEISLVLYCLTLVPGIIRRLQWWPNLTRPVGAILMLYRRHFGILMFMTAFFHMTFTTYIPYYALYNFNPPGLPPLGTFQLMGMIAWLLLFPLWLTSNDLAQRKLGKNWSLLHKLTYVALFFIFFHVALQESKWMVLVGAFVVLEIISWVTVWRRTIALKVANDNDAVPPVENTEG